MAVGPAVLMGASFLLPVALSIIEHLQGDPEATVSEALKRVQRQEEREVMARSYSEERGRTRIAESTYDILPADKLMQQLTLTAQGVQNPPGSMPAGGSGTLDQVAAALNIDPNELKARFDPRQEGLLTTGNSLSQMAIQGQGD